VKNISWRAWLAALALVVFGFALGVGATTYVGLKRLRENLNNPANARLIADRALERIHRNITEELKLTPEESAQLKTTLATGAANLRTIRQRSLRESRAEIDRLVKQISEELPQEKRAVFRRHLAKQLMWLNNPRREGPPPPGPGGPGPGPGGERPPKSERKD
jgi:hypothetical protein